MTESNQKTLHRRKMLAYLGFAFILVLGAVFSFGSRPAQADSFAQVASATATATTTATLAAGGVGVGTGTAVSGTRTAVPSLAAPAGGVGTSTSLVPVTGADLSQPDPNETGKIVLRVAAGILGLLLVAFGIRASSVKR
jgi:hypothetical protein